jgi:WD40 repeat protein
MVTLWHTQSGSVFRQFCPIEDDYISASAFAPNGRLIAFSYGREVITWNTDTDEIRTIISGGRGSRYQFEALAISPNGKELATGSGDGVIAIWNFHTGKRLFSLRNTTIGWWDDVRDIQYRHQCLTYSRDGDNLSFASSEKSAFVYQMRGCRGVGLEANLEQILEVCISPDGKKAAFLGFNSYLEDKRIVLLIDLEKKIELCTLEVKVRNRSTPEVGFSHDGTKIALPSSNRTVAIHDADSGALLLRFTVEKAHAIAVAWLPDNRSIVLALADGTVGIWDTQM